LNFRVRPRNETSEPGIQAHFSLARFQNALEKPGLRKQSLRTNTCLQGVRIRTKSSLDVNLQTFPKRRVTSVAGLHATPSVSSLYLHASCARCAIRGRTNTRTRTVALFASSLVRSYATGIDRGRRSGWVERRSRTTETNNSIRRLGGNRSRAVHVVRRSDDGNVTFSSWTSDNDFSRSTRYYIRFVTVRTGRYIVSST